ncbi:MAG: ComF family protein [Bacteroidales bacterium]|nr:ComF family protein [Bacteroidales bacterium]
MSLNEQYLCLHCEADFPLTRYALLEENPMAERYNAAIAAMDALQDGRIPPSPQPSPYEYAAALFFYDEQAGYSRIPQALKYDGRLRLGRHFAARLGAALSKSPLFADVDLIVPVPLHARRRFSRGYNQAGVIAREIARVMGECRNADAGAAGKPGAASPRVCDHLLRRIRSTHSQTALSGEEKRRNVSGAFGVNEGALAALGFRSPGALSPRHLLLVDDVFTSGSTLAACHQALRKILSSGVRISAATLAFVRQA